MTTRRPLLRGAGAMLLASPFATEAQQPGKVYRIGWMIGGSVSTSAHLNDAFRQAMRELGWVEGKNIEYEIRAAEGKIERFPEIVAELLRLKVDLFLTPTTQATRAARSETFERHGQQRATGRMCRAVCSTTFGVRPSGTWSEQECRRQLP